MHGHTEGYQVMQTSQHILLGYILDLESYICYNPLTKNTMVSSHVLFHEENVLPFSDPIVHSKPHLLPPLRLTPSPYI